MTLLESLRKQFVGYNVGENVGKCLMALVECGVLRLHAPIKSIVDSNPIARVHIFKDEEEANKAFFDGWELLGASRTEPFEFAMGLRKSKIPKSGAIPQEESQL